MKYGQIVFWKELRLDDAWQPNPHATPYLHRLEAPEWTITRETGDCVYTVQRGSGPAYEVPESNVRYARRMAEPAPGAEAEAPAPEPAPASKKGGKRVG